jgi:hypothetical protein
MLRPPPIVAPMDRRAPAGPGFLQQFQARAGWWSQDGKWFAFESNRLCNDLSGATPFSSRMRPETKPAMQVTSCDWNVQLGSTGDRAMPIAAAASKGERQFHIATLDAAPIGYALPFAGGPDEGRRLSLRIQTLSKNTQSGKTRKLQLR